MAQLPTFNPQGARGTNFAQLATGTGSYAGFHMQADALQTAANFWADQAEFVGQIEDERMEHLAFTAGITQGLSPTFDPNNIPEGITIADKAFREGAVQSYTAVQETELDIKLQDLALEHWDDPVTFRAMSQNMLEGATSQMPAIVGGPILLDGMRSANNLYANLHTSKIKRQRKLQEASLTSSLEYNEQQLEQSHPGTKEWNQYMSRAMRILDQKEAAGLLPDGEREMFMVRTQKLGYKNSVRARLEQIPTTRGKLEELVALSKVPDEEIPLSDAEQEQFINVMRKSIQDFQDLLDIENAETNAAIAKRKASIAEDFEISMNLLKEGKSGNYGYWKDKEITTALVEEESEHNEFIAKNKVKYITQLETAKIKALEEQETIAEYNTRSANHDTFDVKEDRDGINLVYEKNRLDDYNQIEDVGARNTAKANFVQKFGGVVPDAIKADIRSGLAPTATQAQMQESADLLSRVVQVAPHELQDNQKLLRTGLAINAAIEAGQDPDVAIPAIVDRFTQQNAAVIDARKAELEQEKITSPDNIDRIINDVFDPGAVGMPKWAGGQGVFPSAPNTPMRSQLEDDVRVIMENSMLSGATVEEAEAEAKRIIGRDWKVQDVDGGGRRLVKHGPMSFYDVGIGEQWIKDQLLATAQEVVPELQDGEVYISADLTTTRQATSTNPRPTYNILVKNESTGNAFIPIHIIAKQRGVATEDVTGMRFLPEPNKIDITKFQENKVDEAAKKRRERIKKQEEMGAFADAPDLLELL